MASWACSPQNFMAAREMHVSCCWGSSCTWSSRPARCQEANWTITTTAPLKCKSPELHVSLTSFIILYIYIIYKHASLEINNSLPSNWMAAGWSTAVNRGDFFEHYPFAHVLLRFCCLLLNIHLKLHTGWGGVSGWANNVRLKLHTRLMLRHTCGDWPRKFVWSCPSNKWSAKRMQEGSGTTHPWSFKHGSMAGATDGSCL